MAEQSGQEINRTLKAKMGRVNGIFMVQQSKADLRVGPTGSSSGTLM
jgi:hypothetical protein